MIERIVMIGLERGYHILCPISMKLSNNMNC
jgi:hypothetical protein